MELATGISNAQSPEGGVLVQFNFYSSGQQQTLTFMPNSPASELMPGSSADPSDQRALPASFMDLPDAVAQTASERAARQADQNRAPRKLWPRLICRR